MRPVIRMIIIITFISSAFVYQAFSAETSPLEIVRKPIEKGLNILKDPKYADSDKKGEQREEIWQLIQQVFDFKIISRGALSRHWRQFSTDQQNRFEKEFTILLKNTYLDKMLSGYRNEEVVFLDEELITKTKAVVKSKILRGSVEIPMDYSVVFRKDKWRVYDIKIEGVSLIKNYRNQFNTILAKEKNEDLIERIKEKNEKYAKSGSSVTN